MTVNSNYFETSNLNGTVVYLIKTLPTNRFEMITKSHEKLVIALLLR